MNEANAFLEEAKRLKAEVAAARAAGAATTTTGESAKGKERALEEALAGE